MEIGESLSRGLKDRLWSELDVILDKSTKFSELYKTNHKIKFGTRKGIEKINQVFQTGFGQCLLAAIKDGSRNMPIMRYALLGVSKDAVKDWNEKTFHILDLSVNAMSQPKFYPTVVRVGEHAVCRVFQRHPQIYNGVTREFEIMKIIPEFKSLAIYGQLMYSIIKVIDINYKKSLEHISLPFVTENGIFLGSYNKEDDLIDVRTFVADNQLTPKQIALTKVLRDHLAENYTPTLPFIFYQMKGANGFPEDMINFYSALSNVAIQFSELVTWNEPNIENKKECQQIIIKFLEVFRKE